MKKLETESLLLKAYEERDKKNFIALVTDPTVMKHVGDGALTETQAEAFWKKLRNRPYPQNFHVWAVFSRENRLYVGHAGLYPRPDKPQEWELVFILNRASWGKGYATQMAGRLMTYGFDDLKLQEIYATVDDTHTASINVLKKSGMKLRRYEHDKDGRFSVFAADNPDDPAA